MANCRFAYANLCWGSGVTPNALSEATGFPAVNLSSGQRWKVWRSNTTTGDQWVEFVFTSASVTTVMLANWKKHGTSGTIKAQYWNGAAYVDYATFTLPSANPTKCVAVFGGQTTTKIRIYFTNVGAVSDYVELGIAFAGTYLEPTTNVNEDLTFTRTDPSVIVPSVDGQEFVQSRSRFYALNSRFSYVSATDKLNLLAMYETNGVRTPLFYAVDITNPDEILYGRFAGDFPVTHLGVDRWEVLVPFQEKR